RRARRQQDGDGLQHAALERPDLVLRRQQLPEGTAAVGLRSPALEFGRDPNAGGEPFLLPAQLLPGKPAVRRQHGAGQHAARPVEDQGADLQSGDARGSYRAGGVGALRLAVFRRPGEIRAVRFRTYRRRRQPALVGQVPVLDQRQYQGRDIGELAQGRPGTSGIVVARLARMAGRNRRRGDTGAQRGLRYTASDRRRPWQLRPGSRVAQGCEYGYNQVVPPGGIRNELGEMPMTRELFWL